MVRSIARLNLKGAIMGAETDKKIDKLVDAFEQVVKPMEALLKHIDYSGRMLKVQTLVAGIALLAVVAMAAIVMLAWRDIARAQETMARVEAKNQAVMDYLQRKFPEDIPQLKVIQAAPVQQQEAAAPAPDAGVQEALKDVEPAPAPPSAKREAGMLMLKHADEAGEAL